jgi:hypothetical protein
MHLKINLQRSHGRLSSREPFIVTEDENLILDFVSDYKLDDLIITLKSPYGGPTQYRARSPAFTVPRELYKAGELSVSVAVLARGEVVKEFTVEPILIREIPAGFEGMPEFEALCLNLRKYAETAAAVLALAEKLDLTFKTAAAGKTLGEANADGIAKIAKILSGYNPIP